MFYIDREDTSLALGHTLEHIALSEDTIDDSDYTILDMSASPG